MVGGEMRFINKIIIGTLTIFVLLLTACESIGSGAMAEFSLVKAMEQSQTEEDFLNLSKVFPPPFIEEYDQLIKKWTEKIKLNQNDASAYYSRGFVYYCKDDYDRAIADFTETIRLNRNYAVAYYCRGLAYCDKSDYDMAIADITEAIRLSPNYAIAYYSRGNAYYDKNDYDMAIADFTKAISLGPNFKYAYSSRGLVYYYGKNDYDMAIADYTEVIRLLPPMIHMPITFAALYMEINEKKLGLLRILKPH